MIPEKVAQQVRRETIYTALKNDGQVNENTIFGVIMKDHASQLKQHIPELRSLISEISGEIRSLDADGLAALAQQEGIAYEEQDTAKDMVELERVANFTTRIPPEPSKHLHVGHALSFLINAIYADRYEGGVVLRFEDTNPALSAQEYVDSIREDVTGYLGIEPKDVSFASDHMDRFYSAAEKLLDEGNAYVCTCDRETMSRLRKEGTECACRTRPASEQRADWENMRSGTYAPGDAVVRLAGDMQAKNMALRDPVLFRIIDHTHYRHGSEYRVWPLYDVENVIMDDLDGVTHILRDNDFGEMRAELQRTIRDHLDLRQPRVHQYGRFIIEGSETSGRAIREGIASGEYTGWDDPRLATLKTMERRGIRAETFRAIAREVGLSPTRTRVDWKMIAKYNRRFVDETAKRYSFVFDPVEVSIKGFPEMDVALRSHPDSEKTDRPFHVDGSFLLRPEDAELVFFRLMDAGNVRKTSDSYSFDSRSIDEFKAAGGSRIVNWLPKDAGQHVPAKIVMPDAQIKEGRVEARIMDESEGSIVQLERFGFCRIDAKDKGSITLWFSHA